MLDLCCSSCTDVAASKIGYVAFQSLYLQREVAAYLSSCVCSRSYMTLLLSSILLLRMVCSRPIAACICKQILLYSKACLWGDLYHDSDDKLMQYCNTVQPDLTGKQQEPRQLRHCPATSIICHQVSPVSACVHAAQVPVYTRPSLLQVLLRMTDQWHCLHQVTLIAFCLSL